jgi:hypothetical protein
VNCNFSNIVTAYNKVWYQLYYDILLSTPNYDISLTLSEPTGFYSAAHAFIPLDGSSLQEIEKACDNCNIHRAIFIDKNNTQSQHTLLSQGYEKIAEECEKWHIKKIDDIPHEVNIMQDISVVAFDVNDHEKRSIFLQIDALTNHLSATLIRQIESRMLARSSYPAILFLAYKDNIPCGCAMLHHYEDMVFFSEGGTLPEYRQCGIHTLLTIKRLQYAKKLKAHKAVMVCSVNSYSNNTAAKLGFILFGQREFYVLQNTNQL